MAFVPLLMAALAVPTTFLVLWPLAPVTDVSVVVQFLIALIGLGVAIDYSLLWSCAGVRNGQAAAIPIVTVDLDAFLEPIRHRDRVYVWPGYMPCTGSFVLLHVPLSRQGHDGDHRQGAAVIQTHHGRTITGASASLAWGAVHLALLSTGEDRAKAMIDWTWAGFSHERAGRISVKTRTPTRGALSAPHIDEETLA